MKSKMFDNIYLIYFKLSVFSYVLLPWALMDRDFQRCYINISWAKYYITGGVLNASLAKSAVTSGGILPRIYSQYFMLVNNDGFIYSVVSYSCFSNNFSKKVKGWEKDKFFSFPPYRKLGNMEIKRLFSGASKLNKAVESKIENLNLKAWFVTGFADAEASFAISIVKSSSSKLGWLVQPDFSIELHIKDLDLVKAINKFFGVGKTRSRIKNGKAISVIFAVRSINELVNGIIPHFDNYPLMTKKREDFFFFKQIVSILANPDKLHLTLEGLKEIVSLRMAMTKAVPKNLLQNFPGVIKSNMFIDLPSIEPNLEWLVGFVNGDGCFFINFQKSTYNKNKISINLKFQITQHSRDRTLFESLRTLLGCGRIQEETKRPVINFIVTKLGDIINIIIPIFEKYHLKGSKILDYKDFFEVSTLMQNKKGVLTEDDYNKIKQIKAGMNKGRVIEDVVIY